MKIEEIKIGAQVENNTEFIDVPLRTKGVIIEDYGTGITIGWDLPDKPYPYDLEPEYVAKMFAIQPNCPIRDGFDKKELFFLDLIK